MPATTSATMNATISASADRQPARVGVGADDGVRVAGVGVPRVRVGAVVVRAHRFERTAAAAIPPCRVRFRSMSAARGAGRTMPRVILDGHNDLVLRRWRGETPKHIDLAPRGRGRLRRRVLRSLRPDRGASAHGAAERAVRRCRSTSRSRSRRRAPHRRTSWPACSRAWASRSPAASTTSSRAGSRRSCTSKAPTRSRPTSRISSAGTTAACARSGSSGRGRTRSPRACRSASRPRPTPAPG